MLLFYKPPHATPRCEVPISEAGSHGMGSGFRALNNQRTLAFVVFLCDTLASPQLHYSPLPVSSSLSLLSRATRPRVGWKPPSWRDCLTPFAQWGPLKSAMLIWPPTRTPNRAAGLLLHDCSLKKCQTIQDAARSSFDRWWPAAGNGNGCDVAICHESKPD